MIEFREAQKAARELLYKEFTDVANWGYLLPRNVCHKSVSHSLTMGHDLRRRDSNMAQVDIKLFIGGGRQQVPTRIKSSFLLYLISRIT